MERVLFNFLFFTLGMTVGVVLMCLMQVGKEADKRIEKMNDWRNDK